MAWVIAPEPGCNSPGSRNEHIGIGAEKDGLALPRPIGPCKLLVVELVRPGADEHHRPFRSLCHRQPGIFDQRHQPRIPDHVDGVGGVVPPEERRRDGPGREYLGRRCLDAHLAKALCVGPPASRGVVREETDL